MSESLRHKTTALAQRALAIDALHRKLDLALERLEALELLRQGIAPVVQGGAASIQSLKCTINDVASRLTGINQRTEMLTELSDHIPAPSPPHGR
jgi:hypothetical protein